MNLKNGYKVMYEVIEGENRVFYVSASDFAHKVKVAEYPVNSVKVIYQDKDHKFYGFAKDNSKLDLTAINNLFVDNGTTAPIHVDEDSDGKCDIGGEDISIEPAPTSYSRKRTKVEEPVAEPEVPAEPIETEEV